MKRHTGLIKKLVRNFSNIPLIDPAQTLEDLESEAYLILLELERNPIDVYAESTVLWKKIENRFIDLYRRAMSEKKKLSELIPEINLPEKPVKSISDLPLKRQKLAKEILNSPGEFDQFIKETGGRFSKASVLKFLTRKKNWRRCTALNTISDLFAPNV